MEFIAKVKFIQQSTCQQNWQGIAALLLTKILKLMF